MVSVETAPSNKDFTRFWSDSVTGISLIDTISSYFLKDNRYNNHQSNRKKCSHIFTSHVFQTGYLWFQIWHSTLKLKNLVVKILVNDQWESQWVSHSIDQSVNQWNVQSISQSINQSISQSASQSVSQSVDRSIDQSILQSINQSINQSVSQTANQSISRLVNKLIEQSVTQQINQQTYHQTNRSEKGNKITNQSIL